MIDRQAASRALAKAIAYKQCGKDAKAEAWAWALVRILECGGILARTDDETASDMAMIRASRD